MSDALREWRELAQAAKDRALLKFNSQRALARELGISSQALIGAVKSARIGWDVVVNLAKVAELAPDDRTDLLFAYTLAGQDAGAKAAPSSLVAALHLARTMLKDEEFRAVKRRLVDAYVDHVKTK